MYIPYSGNFIAEENFAEENFAKVFKLEFSQENFACVTSPSIYKQSVI